MNNNDFRLVYEKESKAKWIIKTLLWSLIFGIFIMFVSGYFLGYRVFTVIGSSSMPHIQKWSVAVDAKVPLDELKIGDHITWSTDGRNFVTHKIIELNYDTGRIVTSQTDYFANGKPVNPDSPITYKNVKGKVVFSIPYVGYFLYGVRSLILSSYGSINILGVMTIILVFLAYYLFKKLLYVETFTLRDR